jgi:death-on-curing family protein
MEYRGEILIYQGDGHQPQVEVRLHGDTIWVTQKSIAALFGIQRPAITKHLSNIFKSRELNKSSVCSVLEHTASDGKLYATKYYNLDAIISIGYRINSAKATKFRQWATQRLKDHLVKGYSINQKRLDQLQQTIQLIEKSGHVETLSLSEAKGLLEIISNYTQSFVLLNRFDNQTLQSDQLSENVTYEIEYKEALSAIAELKKQLVQKKEASELFGKQKDDSFAGILGNVVQSFGGEYLYKSIEEQAAHLLYFIIKNHPFTDGNKRIGAFLFIWFLEKNRHRFKKSGELKINDNALVALALLVAQCNPSDKEMMIKLIINLIRS